MNTSATAKMSHVKIRLKLIFHWGFETHFRPSWKFIRLPFSSNYFYTRWKYLEAEDYGLLGCDAI
jgi:hypothetical protein